MTLRQAYNRAQTTIGAQGGRWLLQSIAGKDCMLRLEDELTRDEKQRIDQAMARLDAGEPLQYVLGSWDFYGFSFKVDKRALIPRPETELLVEAGLKLIENIKNPRIVDLGAGTGCIGISIKLKRPDARVRLIDISTQACSLAGENAESLGAEVEIKNMDMTRLDGMYDLILSNPPYIKSADIQGLDDSVKRYEPMRALDGGGDGLDYYRLLERLANRCLAEGGAMALEIGMGQRRSIEEIFHGYQIRFLKDLQQLDRIAQIKVSGG